MDYKITAYVRGFQDKQWFEETYEKAQIKRSQVMQLMGYDDVRVESNKAVNIA